MCTSCGLQDKNQDKDCILSSYIILKEIGRKVGLEDVARWLSRASGFIFKTGERKC